MYSEHAGTELVASNFTASQFTSPTPIMLFAVVAMEAANSISDWRLAMLLLALSVFLFCQSWELGPFNLHMGRYAGPLPPLLCHLIQLGIFENEVIINGPINCGDLLI